MKPAKVYIQGPSFYSSTVRTFEENGRGAYSVVQDIRDSDIVVLTGGEDINPKLYGEKPISGTYFSNRDVTDLRAVEQGIKYNKFLVGICRGAQLINCVPNGGTLWQDVDGHESSNHQTFDCVTGTWLITNSVHHQMMRPAPSAELLCWASESTERRSENEVWYSSKQDPVLESERDVEGLWYPDTQSLLVQFHPEFGHKPTARYFFDVLMMEYFWNKKAVVETAA